MFCMVRSFEIYLEKKYPQNLTEYDIKKTCPEMKSYFCQVIIFFPGELVNLLRQW